MTELEKVIEGLECCSVKQSCSECPWKGLDCNDRLHLAALELLKEQPKQRFFVDSDGKITPLPIQPQWHPFNPVEPDTDGLEDHNFYLVTVKGFGTPMKAMYHIDMPFGFTPPPTKDFDPYDVIAWCELPDNMDEEVKQNADD